MNYRKIIETAIECERREAQISTLISAHDAVSCAADAKRIQAQLVSARDRYRRAKNRLKQLVEETV
jgi:hypothetical protein